jgi:predicted ATP-binding protein involved in virulence
MSEADARGTTRLSAFRVERLFNEFDYYIPFNTHEHITAILAPNGSGKTVCLRLINALFKRQWSLLNRTSLLGKKYAFEKAT